MKDRRGDWIRSKGGEGDDEENGEEVGWRMKKELRHQDYPAASFHSVCVCVGVCISSFSLGRLCF